MRRVVRMQLRQLLELLRGPVDLSVVSRQYGDRLLFAAGDVRLDIVCSRS